MNKSLLNIATGEGLRFLTVGLMATCIDLIVFAILNYFTEVNNSINFIIAFYLSVLCRFFADRNFTFKIPWCSDKYGMSIELLLYIFSCTATMLIGLWSFHAVHWMGCSNMISKIASIPPVTLAGYLLFKFIVFRTKSNVNTNLKSRYYNERQ
jgi:putative flippase GtrA